MANGVYWTYCLPCHKQKWGEDGRCSNRFCRPRVGGVQEVAQRNPAGIFYLTEPPPERAEEVPVLPKPKPKPKRRRAASSSSRLASMWKRSFWYEEILAHPGLQGQTRWWDQFGNIESGQHVKPHALILPEALQMDPVVWVFFGVPPQSFKRIPGIQTTGPQTIH